MQELGNRTEDSTIDFKWSTNDTDGAAITRATNGTVAVYKSNDTTQSVAGLVDTEDFDTVTGIHHCRIDTSADAFYEVGKDYQVVLSAATIDGFTVNAVLAAFRLEYGFAEVDVVKWLGTAAATPTVAGVPEVDTTHVGGTLQTAGDIIGRLPAALIGGRIDASVGAMAVGVLTAAAIAADAITAAKLAADVTTELQSGLSTLTAAQVNTEMLDVLNVDTFAEPGQEAPPATTTLVKKLGWLYKAFRNRITQDSTTLKIYADDATTVDAKATTSDSGSLYDRNELVSGP